jgi:Myb-like DNA-binding domain
MVDSDDDENETQRQPPDETAGPSTPKRIRLAPEVIPMGLERSDFNRLAREPSSIAAAAADAALKAAQDTTTDAEGSGNGNASKEDEWSSAEDRLLVELVLEKLKLSKSDWQDCARSLGKDRNSVGRRWKSLMGHGEVGLKRGGGGGGHLRRGKIHATWRA